MFENSGQNGAMGRVNARDENHQFYSFYDSDDDEIREERGIAPEFEVSGHDVTTENSQFFAALHDSSFETRNVRRIMPRDDKSSARYIAPKTGAAMLLAAANFSRFFSAKDAAQKLFNTNIKAIIDAIGGASVVANTGLGAFGMDSAYDMKKAGLMRICQISLILAAGTALSDDFNGIWLASTPMNDARESEDPLIANLATAYIVFSALTVFLTSFLLNIASIGHMDRLWCSDPKDILASEALSSLSYFLMGRDEDDLEDGLKKYKNIIADALRVVLEPESSSVDLKAMPLNQKKKLATLLGLKEYETDEQSSLIDDQPPIEDAIQEKLNELGLACNDYKVNANGLNIITAFRTLTRNQIQDFIEKLREKGMPIATTQNSNFLWFMKKVAMALALPSAIVLFYGPYTLLRKLFGESTLVTSLAIVFGLFPIPVKFSVYNRLLLSLFNKMYHIGDTRRNIRYIAREQYNLSERWVVLGEALFVAASLLILSSGVGFYDSVEEFLKFIYGRAQKYIFGGVADVSSDGLADIFSDGVSGPSHVLKIFEGIYEWGGVLNACLINYSAVLNVIQSILKSYLSLGYNWLSNTFNAKSVEFASIMPAKPPTGRLVDTATYMLETMGAVIYGCFSNGPSNDDEEILNLSAGNIQDDAELAAVTEEASFSATSTNSRSSFATSSYSFFRYVGDHISIPRFVSEPFNRARECCCG